MKTNIFLLMILGLLATACNGGSGGDGGFHLDISGTVRDLNGVPLEPQPGRRYNVCFKMKFRNKETGATTYLDKYSGNQLPANDYNCWEFGGKLATFHTETDVDPGQFNDDYNPEDWEPTEVLLDLAVIPAGIDLDWQDPDPSNCKKYIWQSSNEAPIWSGAGLNYEASAEFTVDPANPLRDLTPQDSVYDLVPACR